MTTTKLRYNGRAFIYAPTSLVARDGERQINVNGKEPHMELNWAQLMRDGNSQASRKQNGQLAMVRFLAATAIELINGENLLRTIRL